MKLLKIILLLVVVSAADAKAELAPLQLLYELPYRVTAGFVSEQISWSSHTSRAMIQIANVNMPFLKTGWVPHAVYIAHISQLLSRASARHSTLAKLTVETLDPSTLVALYRMTSGRGLVITPLERREVVRWFLQSREQGKRILIQLGLIPNATTQEMDQEAWIRFVHQFPNTWEHYYPNDRGRVSLVEKDARLLLELCELDSKSLAKGEDLFVSLSQVGQWNFLQAIVTWLYGSIPTVAHLNFNALINEYRQIQSEGPDSEYTWFETLTLVVDHLLDQRRNHLTRETDVIEFRDILSFTLSWTSSIGTTNRPIRSHIQEARERLRLALDDFDRRLARS